MKKITLFFALLVAASYIKAQGLEGVVVEKYYLTNSADSTNASNNSSATDLHKGSVTYRVFIDMAPGYEFSTIYGNQDAQSNPLHPLVFKTSTNFYNDPNNGQIYPQGNSVINTKKNTTLIDSWLSVGGVCAGKMGVLKSEDTDGAIGNSNGVLMNNPGGVYGVAINSVIAGAQDGLLPGSPLAPQAIGITNETDIFDQTPGGTFSVTNSIISALGGAMGVTASNMILIGQFTTDGVFCFSVNVQVTNTVTNVGELYVHNASHADHGGVPVTETTFAGLSYCSAATNTNVGVGIEVINYGGDLATFSIHPNPSHGIFTIMAGNVKADATNAYTVYDVMGRPILSKTLEKTSGTFYEPVNLSDYPAGVYFLNLSLNGVTSTKKIIKE
jgi:hypothetical protein